MSEESSKRLTWKEFLLSPVGVIPGLFIVFFLLIGAIVGLAGGYRAVFSADPWTTAQWISRLRNIAVGALLAAVAWGLFGLVQVFLDPEESPWRGRKEEPSGRASMADAGLGSGRRTRAEQGFEAPPSAAELPWPEKWPQGRQRVGVTISMFALGLGMLVAGLVLLVGESKLAGGVFLLAVALLLFGVTALGAARYVIRPSRGSVRVEVSPPDGTRTTTGIAVPYSTTVTATFVVVNAIYGVTGAAVTVAGLLGYSLILLGLGLVLLGMCVYGFVQIARGRLRRGRLLLTPDGVEQHSWGSGAAVEWGAILTVAPMEIERAPHVLLVVSDPDGVRTWQISRGTHAHEHTVEPHVPLALQPLAADPALIYHALRYYHECPESRRELGGPAAAGRIRRGDLPAAPYGGLG